MPSSPADQPPWAPAILDIEASGFGAGSYPIEVGFVTSQGQSWCSLVHPEPEWRHWDPRAESVHGIRREQLLRHGRPAREVAQLLNEKLAGLTLYSDAWSHDYSWLSRLFDAAGSAPRFKLDHLRALLSDAQAARWHELRQQVTARLGLQRHRASADARVLQQTFMALHGGPRGEQRAAA